MHINTQHTQAGQLVRNIYEDSALDSALDTAGGETTVLMAVSASIGEAPLCWPSKLFVCARDGKDNAGIAPLPMPLMPLPLPFDL